MDVEVTHQPGSNKFKFTWLSFGRTIEVEADNEPMARALAVEKLIKGRPNQVLVTKGATLYKCEIEEPHWIRCGSCKSGFVKPFMNEKCSNDKCSATVAQVNWPPSAWQR